MTYCGMSETIETIPEIEADLRRRAKCHCGVMVRIYEGIADRLHAAEINRRRAEKACRESPRDLSSVCFMVWLFLLLLVVAGLTVYGMRMEKDRHAQNAALAAEFRRIADAAEEGGAD